MKVVAIQMVSTPKLTENLLAAHALLAQASQMGAELAVLPEYFCLMGHADSDKLAIAEPDNEALEKNSSVGIMQKFLSHAAQTFGLWIVGGTVPLQAPNGKVFNSSLVYDRNGKRVARYDKIHLFRYDNGREAYDESRVLVAGNAPVLFEMTSRAGEHWRIGLSICYDLRFAELYRAYADLGADLLLVPSAFTHTTGQAHWEVLLRARAIENQAFVVAAAQGGLHENGRRTWGHSLMVDPWGEVLAQLPTGAGLVCHDLLPGRIASCRAQLPALSHRVLSRPGA